MAHTHQLELLAEAIKDDLEAINGAAPYTQTMRYVTRDAAMIGQMQIWPNCVMVLSSCELAADITNKMMHRWATWLFLVEMEAVPGTDPTTAAATLMTKMGDDIFFAMQSPNKSTHGGQCHLTEWLGFDLATPSGTGKVNAIFTYRFRYSFALDSP